MTADEFKTACERLWGETWKPHASESLRVDVSTISRWMNGKVTIPGPVVAALECLTKAARARRKQRKAKVTA